MAEDLAQNKTEDPTPRRREDARQQGRVAFSAELATGALLLAGMVGLWMMGETIASGLVGALRLDWRDLHQIDPDGRAGPALLARWLGRGLLLLGPLLGLLLLAGVATGLFQAGLHVVPELALPRWERLSPVHGWSRLLSAAGLLRGLLALLKTSAIGLLALGIVRGRFGQMAHLGEGSLGSAAASTWDLAMRLGLAITASLVLIGLVDYVWQRWRLEVTLRMTRQELKEEIKREEGDPQVKARLRKLQRELGKWRMLQDVPRATVVVTNPTHLAIALRYDRGTMAAPRVVAKGAGQVARRIADLARRHAVPVVERKPLAQALYRAVKVGQEIPTALYYAVAELLAYVYRLRGTE